jgi:aspartate aminotransferase
MITRQSWIRKMFEEGARLKAIHGAANVFDFSLGNPNLAPPSAFFDALRRTVAEGSPHGYMPNTGFPEACKAVAGYLTAEQQVDVAPSDVIMTCGAAGALNIALKALLDPGDVVLCPAPYFVEYNAYADNHGGILKPVATHTDFTLNLDAMAAAIDGRTKAVLINSPNNPTGQVYSQASLEGLGAVLSEKSKRLGRTICLISDEPYRKIVYDGITVPSLFNCYPESILATSYSKDISIPGERIGFAAVNPKAAYRTDVLNGLALANRILGFVNAPALMQKVIMQIQGACVDPALYRRKRDMLCDALASFGYCFTKPAGTFYLFPRAPISDDVAFVRALQEELILVVPGSGFGGPGYFRIAFCVDDATIANALPGFKRAIEKAKNIK